MRDAFGGAFSIKLMLIFLMLYVAFICVALYYARAFRVKNRIINIIEQYEGYCGVNKEQINNDINTYLSTTGYYISYADVSNVVGKNGSQTYDCLNDFGNGSLSRGYCVYNKSNNSHIQTCSDKAIYSVETYMIFKLPIINIRFPIVIKGETRPVERIDT